MYNNDYFCYQVVLGLGFRVYEAVSKYFDWQTKRCWQVNRGEDLSPVLSCEGMSLKPVVLSLKVIITSTQHITVPGFPIYIYKTISF